MLDASYPGHLPRKPVEVLVEGDKVPATVYLAKQVDPAAAVAGGYESRVRDLVRRLGEPVLTNFEEHTYRADGTPAYRETPPEPEADADAPAVPEGA